MHGPRECTVDVELVATIDEITFVGGRNSSYNQYPNNFSQGQGFRQNEGMYRPQPMQNQRPVQEERQPTLQETTLQYMTLNDQRMKLVES